MRGRICDDCGVHSLGAAPGCSAGGSIHLHASILSQDVKRCQKTWSYWLVWSESLYYTVEPLYCRHPWKCPDYWSVLFSRVVLYITLSSWDPSLIKEVSLFEVCPDRGISLCTCSWTIQVPHIQWDLLFNCRLLSIIFIIFCSTKSGVFTHLNDIARSLNHKSFWQDRNCSPAVSQLPKRAHSGLVHLLNNSKTIPQHSS